MWKETDMGKNVKERAGWPCPCCFATHHGGVFQTLISSCLNYFNSFLTGPLPPVSPPPSSVPLTMWSFSITLWSNGFLWNSAMASPCLQNDVGTPACCSRISIEQFTSPGLLCATPAHTPKYSLLPSAGHAQYHSHSPRLPYICSCFFSLSLVNSASSWIHLDVTSSETLHKHFWIAHGSSSAPYNPVIASLVLCVPQFVCLSVSHPNSHISQSKPSSYSCHHNSFSQSPSSAYKSSGSLPDLCILLNLFTPSN